MADEQVDLVVLGLGPGGEHVATEAARSGLAVVAVEERLVGGECPYFGCIPSKMAVRAAGTLAEARRVTDLAGSAQVAPDWSPVARRIREEATDDWDDTVAVRRLEERARSAGVTNLTALLGDATGPIVPAGSFDVVFLAMTLGEIPDRAAVLAQCHRALKPGGVLSITEMIPDPHYQSRTTVKRLAEEAGFRLRSIHGSWWLFTATFVKVGADGS